MQGPGQPSLDQLQVFLTVVETGSFAAAGRKLGRATSAVRPHTQTGLDRDRVIGSFRGSHGVDRRR